MLAACFLAPALLGALTDLSTAPAGSLGAYTQQRFLVGRPNIVLVVIDDLGWGDPGVYGNALIQTPTLDRLAAEGTRLTSFCTNGSVCSPSRASFLTGKYPLGVGLQNALAQDSLRGLPTEIPTVADALKAAGYKTAHVGKWHVGQPNGPAGAGFLPTAQGFDWSRRLVWNPFVSHIDPEISIDETASVVIQGHDTDVLTDCAIEFLDTCAGRGQPVFLNLWYFAPHLPAQAPQAYLDLYPPGSTWSTYAAMVTHVDARLDDVLARLDALGIADDTLVIVTSDNGGADAAGLHPDGNGPLAGFKRDFLEGGLRVPFLARWPGHVPPGTVNDSLALGSDLLPTVLDLLDLQGGGAAAIEAFDLPGKSLWPTLSSGAFEARPETLFWSGRADIAPQAPPHAVQDGFAVRQDRALFGGPDWKLVRLSDGSTALFDLDTDPFESANRLLEFPDVASELWQAYWQHHLAISELAWTASACGAVEPTAGGYHLTDGAVVLDPSARFDAHDGDFSLRLSVLTERVAAQVIAARPGSWQLALDGANQLVLTIDTADGQVATLSSTTALVPFQVHTVGFSAAGWLAAPTDVALAVDGVFEAQAQIEAFASSASTILFGNGGDCAASAGPFAGLLEDIHLHSSALVAEEFAGLVPALPELAP